MCRQYFLLLNRPVDGGDLRWCTETVYSSTRRAIPNIYRRIVRSASRRQQ